MGCVCVCGGGGGGTKSIAEHAVLTFSRARLGAWDLPYFGLADRV